MAEGEEAREGQLKDCVRQLRLSTRFAVRSRREVSKLFPSLSKSFKSLRNSRMPSSFAPFCATCYLVTSTWCNRVVRCRVWGVALFNHVVHALKV